MNTLSNTNSSRYFKISTPKNITPITKPTPKNTTPKNTTNTIHNPLACHFKIPNKKYIKLFVISHSGHLVRPHTPDGDPPPLNIPIKPTMKRPICKNPNKIVL